VSSFHDLNSLALILDTGICFGHQIVARAVGGECVPNSGKWEIGTTHVDLSPIGQSLFGSPTLVSTIHPFGHFSFLMVLFLENPTDAS
jgi:hypothetical protein